MKTTVTYVKRYYKAKTVGVEVPDGWTDKEIDEYLQAHRENWNKVDDATLDFEDSEILYY